MPTRLDPGLRSEAMAYSSCPQAGRLRHERQFAGHHPKVFDEVAEALLPEVYEQARAAVLTPG
jgi:hypothetical protein